MPTEEGDDVHHAIITGVRLSREAVSTEIVISLSSLDVQCSSELSLTVPKGWEANVHLGSDFDPMTLPQDAEEEQQTIFRRNFANNKHDSWFQRLVFNGDSIARRFGKNPKTLNIIQKSQTMDDYVHNLKEMLLGVECYMLRRRQTVWEVLSLKEREDDDKRFDIYERAWEQN